MPKKSVHDCELPKNYENILPGLPPNAPFKIKLQRFIFKFILVSSKNQLAKECLRSSYAITSEKRRHVRAKHWFIIHPFSRFRTFWERFMTVVLIVSLYEIPMAAAFTGSFGVNHKREKVEKFWEQIGDGVDLICLTDCFLNFMTGYRLPKTREIVIDPLLIARHYAKGYFTIDFLSSVPLHLIRTLMIQFKVASGSHRSVDIGIHMLNLLKILRLKTLLQCLNQFPQIHNLGGMAKNMINFVFVTVFYVHWMSCMHFFIPSIVYANVKNEDIDRESWIKELSLDEEPQTVRCYSFCFCRTVALMCTLTYGNAPPKTYEDSVLSLINIITGVTLWTYITVVILQYRFSSEASRLKYLEMLNQLKQYMAHKQLPELLQARMLAYYEHRFKKHYFRETAIMTTLSDILRDEILIHECYHLIENVEIFNGVSRKILLNIIRRLKPEVFLPNDVIQKAGQYGDCMFLISYGTVAAYSPSGREMYHLEDGAHFGVLSLMTDEPIRTYSVVAISTCDMYILERRDFEACIRPTMALYKRMLDKAIERRNFVYTFEEKFK